MAYNSDTLNSRVVSCSGGWRSWFNFLKSRGGAVSQSGWYLKIKRREEGSGQRNSLVVENRRGAEVVEQREVLGVLYDGETGEEEEWLMDLGSEREQKAWAAACRSNHALLYCEHKLGLANAELEACRARVLRHQCNAEDAWEEVDAMKRELAECREEMEEWRLRYQELLDVIQEVEEQLNAAEQVAEVDVGEGSGMEEGGCVDAEELTEDEGAEEGGGYMVLGGGQVEQDR